jgi:hypothetical protein
VNSSTYIGHVDSGDDEDGSHEERQGHRFSEDEKGKEDCAHGNKVDELSRFRRPQRLEARDYL